MKTHENIIFEGPLRPYTTYLHAGNARRTIGVTASPLGDKKILPKLHGALIKNEQDIELFEQLAFMSRNDM